MNVRRAVAEDMEEILKIYAIARDFMRETNNPNQWKNSYPSEEILREDIAKQNLYLICEEEILAVFAFIQGIDPTYNQIDGAWLNNEPYWAIHRVASAGKKKGMLREAVNYALQFTDNIKIDTHENNTVMQHQLEKEGFIPCGIIRLLNGEPRIAYQKYVPSEK